MDSVSHVAMGGEKARFRVGVYEFQATASKARESQFRILRLNIYIQMGV
jgi:hypothetical protein